MMRLGWGSRRWCSDLYWRLLSVLRRVGVGRRSTDSRRSSRPLVPAVLRLTIPIRYSLARIAPPVPIRRPPTRSTRIETRRRRPEAQPPRPHRRRWRVVHCRPLKARMNTHRARRRGSRSLRRRCPRARHAQRRRTPRVTRARRRGPRDARPRRLGNQVLHLAFLGLLRKDALPRLLVRCLAFLQCKLSPSTSSR